MAEKKTTAKPALMDRLKSFECKELESNELVQRIIENAKSRHLEFDLAGEPIRVVAAFPRAVRYYYEQQRKKSQQDNKMEYSDVEQEGYKILAMLCLDAPFNTTDFWALFDDQTGQFWSTFNAIYAGIEKNEEKIGDFRKK